MLIKEKEEEEKKRCILYYKVSEKMMKQRREKKVIYFRCLHVRQKQKQNTETVQEAPNEDTGAKEDCAESSHGVLTVLMSWITPTQLSPTQNVNCLFKTMMSK